MPRPPRKRVRPETADDLDRRLAEDSTTGAWVEGSNFAVIVLTNPRYPFHLIDAGGVVQDMQLAAWDFGVASCVYTGVREEAFRKDFNIPREMNPSIIVGFGYPARKISGKRKNRKPLSDLVFLGEEAYSIANTELVRLAREKVDAGYDEKGNSCTRYSALTLATNPLVALQIGGVDVARR